MDGLCHCAAPLLGTAAISPARGNENYIGAPIQLVTAFGLDSRFFNLILANINGGNVKESYY